MGFSGSGISFTGLGSGIDTETLIQQLIALEKRPILRLQLQQTQLQTKLDSITQYKSLLNVLRKASVELNSKNAFQAMKGTSTNPDVATITAGSNSTEGTYQLKVFSIAQAHKIASAGQSSATNALGFSGAFLVNGKAINVVLSDSLSSIASKINDADAGVVASIINGGAGNVYLTMTAEKTGADNALILSDVGSGNVLESLGVLSGATSIRDPIPNGAKSMGFSDSSTAVGTLLGVSVPSGTIEINGISINIDFTSDSLNTIATKINNAGGNFSATVVTEQIAGETKYFLQITGSPTLTFIDNNHMLENLGILQRNYGNEILAAQDASFELDGISFTNSSNTIYNVIPGATITLLDGDTTNPLETTLTIQRSTTEVVEKLQSLVQAYNAIVEFLKTAASFDKETLESGILFGDSAVLQTQSLLFGSLMDAPDGISGIFKNLLAIGISFDSDGKMTLDSAAFENALSANVENVISLFTEIGTIDDPYIEFISAGPKTKESGATGYEIVITQLATQASFTAGTAFSMPSTEPETITFDGNLFGNQPYYLNVESGSTIDDVILQINSDAKLKNLIVASKTVDNKLVLTSKKYGTPGNFTVVSDKMAAPNNSGIGLMLQSATGLDVAGTMNGEAATGNGQILTGNSGNATTDGLQIMITGGSTGSRGFMVFTKGAASKLEDALNTALDTINGLIPSSENSIQSQIDDISQRIEHLNEIIKLREETLRRRFKAMEEAMARLQSQMVRLSQLFATEI
ncbi:MAG TPA: flagellar filament capping protein FliD [Fimbriimonadales bacterium]|nr:flagellar filament capping protein FliD [Fimbriimonadales bacterium]